jgi:hypothetical protein
VTVNRVAKAAVEPQGEGRLFERSGAGGLIDDQESRERILLAAARLFANKGYAGAAVREIVDAAGVTKPTLYYYFKNKEELYVQLMDRAMGTCPVNCSRPSRSPGCWSGRGRSVPKWPIMKSVWGSSRNWSPSSKRGINRGWNSGVIPFGKSKPSPAS